MSRACIAVSLLALAACRGGSPVAPTPAPISSVSVQHIALVPSPASLPIGGGTTQILIATSADKVGSSIAANALVTLSTTAGSLSVSSVETDFTGHATVTWTGSSTATISASSSGVTSSATVTVDIPTPTPTPSPTPTPPSPMPPAGPGPLFIDVFASPRLTDTSTPVDFSLNARGYNGSADPTGLTYAWNFGDGVTSTAPTPTHLYTRAADHYTVTVDVTAADGRAGRGTLDVVVGLTPPPTVTFGSATASPSSAQVGQVIIFSATASGNAQAGAITGYVWDFGDHTTGSGANATHTYASAGVHTASVTATSISGASASASVPVTITDPIAVAMSVSPSGTQPSGTALTVTATVTSASGTLPSSLMFSWDYNNDGTVDEITTNGSPGTGHAVYSTSGIKTIRVTVTTPDGRTATNTITVTVS